MGAGQIIQKNITDGCQYMWNKVPSIPQLSIDLSQYNKSFVNFSAILGAYALYKSSIYLTKKSIEKIKGQAKVPSLQKMQHKYGQNSWALIVDCKGNQAYCILLAQKGFGLILCGQQDDIKIVQDRLLRETQDLNYKTETIIIDWSDAAKDFAFYQELLIKLEHFDISIMVMPTISKQKKCSTHLQASPVFQHIYLMARYFAPKLKWRTNTSAIIVPSSQSVDMIDDGLNGVTKAVQSGIDAFGRILSFEFKGIIQVIVARGSPQNALADLGIKRVSH